MSSQSSYGMPVHRPSFLVLVVLLSLAAGATGGWLVNDGLSSGNMTPSQQLRLGGNYRFINPLLACDNGFSDVLPEFRPLETKVQALVDSLEKNNDISKASVYVRDLQTGRWSDVGGNEKFYPASLGKIPILMAYLKIAESNPAILQEKLFYMGDDDLNAQQEIRPAKAIAPHQAYTIQELLEDMTRYSDNNATALLTQHVDKNTLIDVYNHLQVPIRHNVNLENLDFIVTRNFSLFFRVLYNATYLSRKASEQALALLTTTDFKNGIVAGSPSFPVAHKFALTSIAPSGTVTERELHDCGIVYHPTHPYLICIMTRSAAPIAKMESAIAAIAKLAYTEANDFK